jgi:MFS family permease
MPRQLSACSRILGRAAAASRLARHPQSGACAAGLSGDILDLVGAQSSMSAQHIDEATAMTPIGRTAHHGRRISGRGALVVVAAAVVMAMGFGGLGLITVFMGPIEADLGWSRASTSLGYAFSTAGMAIGGVIWGRLSDRMDVRILLAIGAAGMAGSLLTMSILTSLLVFCLANVAYGGFGFSVVYSPLLSTSGEWFPERRGLVTGLVTAGGALGQGVLPFFASILINAFGWRWAFFGIGCTLLSALALASPVLRWPQGTKAPGSSSTGAPATARAETVTVAILALAAFFCCVCMGVPVVHMASFIGMICGSPAVGVSSLVIAMISGGVGRICCGVIADRIGPLKAYAMASAIQTACVMAFPALSGRLSLMALSALFGFGFAGNMTCLSICIRQAVPASRFGGAIGAVMMIAWAGMAFGGYVGGVLFDWSASYTPSFLLAGAAGVLNLSVIAAFAATRDLVPSPGPGRKRQGASRHGSPLSTVAPSLTAP